MTRDEFVDTLMRRLGNRKDTQDTVRNAIIAELLHLIPNSLEKEPELPWFLLQDTSFTTYADIEYRDVGDTYISLWEDGGIWFQDDTNETEYRLVIDDWDYIRDKYADYESSDSERSGAPKYGAMINGVFYMRPIPDAVYTLKIWQFGHDDLSSLSGTYGDGNGGNTCVWLTEAPEWVLGEVGSIIAATMLSDEKAAANMVGIANRARQKVMDRNVVEMEKLKQRFMEG